MVCWLDGESLLFTSKFSEINLGTAYAKEVLDKRVKKVSSGPVLSTHAKMNLGLPDMKQKIFNKVLND